MSQVFSSIVGGDQHKKSSKKRELECVRDTTETWSVKRQLAANFIIVYVFSLGQIWLWKYIFCRNLLSDILSLGPFGPTFGSRVISEKWDGLRSRKYDCGPKKRRKEKDPSFWQTKIFFESSIWFRHLEGAARSWQIYFLCVGVGMKTSMGHGWNPAFWFKWSERVSVKNSGCHHLFPSGLPHYEQRGAHPNLPDCRRRRRQSVLLNSWKPQGFPRQGVASPLQR